MYKVGGVGGLVGGGTLAVTGFSTFAGVAIALGLLLLGLAMVRYSAVRLLGTEAPVRDVG